MLIRPATPEDAAAIAALVTQLSYPTTPVEATQRLARLTPPDHAVFLAVDGDRAVGLIHIAISASLEHDSRAVISALVVDESQRGRGAGAWLVAAAEQWAIQRGVRVVRVRSNVKRERARKFYERLGYRVTKSQNVFDKDLS